MSAPLPSTGGRLVYAVGDVHGYSAQLGQLMVDIRADAERSNSAERPRLIFVGDYVDRGPDSRGVIEAVMALQGDPQFEVVSLRGNHEHALLRFLDEPEFARAWITNWGEATLQSYGVALMRGPMDGVGCARVRAEFAGAFPPAHRLFLERLPLSERVGDYLFVHAGVRPGVALADQSAHDLMWIRQEFLGSDADFGAVVVHGHTPSGQPERKANRIGIDTGVYMSGVLTAVRLAGTDVRFIQAGV